MPPFHPGENRRAHEAAKSRADAFGRVLFAGIAEEQGLLLADYRVSLPREVLPAAAAFAGALHEAGIFTPERLAYYLSTTHGKAARCYSQALWNALSVIDVTKSAQPAWHEIYADIEAGHVPEDEPEPEKVDTEPVEDREDDDDDEEDDDHDAPETAEAVQQWAAGVGEELATLEMLLERATARPGLNPDHRDGIDAMSSDLAALRDGELPARTWRLSLTLSQGMDDGSSHGTRTYEIAVDEDGIAAGCHGTEYERGEGSDSWTGATFRYAVGARREETGDLYAFAAEFQEAAGDSDYLLALSLNDESIGKLPHAERDDSAGEHLAINVLRQVISDLQEINATLSGDDSGLENTWDEICAQQQIEESVTWDVYETTMTTLIEGYVSELSHEDLVALWLLTDEGESWEIDRESENEKPCPAPDDVTGYLFGLLLSVASDYLNDRIISFRDRRYAED